MGSRCFIAHIDRNGMGRAIYCHQGAPPDQNGVTLLRHYQDEQSVKTITALRSISSLSNDPGITAKFNQDSTYPVLTFHGGTDAFFGHFWTTGTEWLYAWTPDGWLAAPGFRELPAELLQHDHDDSHPLWERTHRRAAAYQVPQPLNTVIKRYLETQQSHPTGT